MRAALGLWVALVVLVPPAGLPATAATGDTRTLYFYHTHTHQTAHFTFKVNGQYDQTVLRQMNAFLADWRTHDQIKMDPALFDLLWTIYREVGANQPINIVSSYRTPATNAYLRSRSRAVAENSQHMKGKAMDIFIPGVPLAKLRAVAMSHQVGGVGFYPTSGSPFVHVDTGGVRAWPRMTRAQLEKVFPDGKTLHLPVDGKPLSDSGRRYAMAEWNKCHMVPCNGGTAYQAPDLIPENPADGGETVMVASGGAPIPATPSENMLSMIFSGQPAPAFPGEPTQRLVATIPVSAPVPATRAPTPSVEVPDTTQVAALETAPVPATELASGSLAPIPATKSAAIRLATGPSIPANDGETALVALANLGAAPIPQPRVLMTPKGQQPAPADDDMMVTAYVPAIQPEPGAQRALQMIIERETTGAVAAPALIAPQPAQGEVHMASLGQPPSGGLDALANLLQDTWSAVTGMGQPPLQAALNARVTPAPNTEFARHDSDFAAPDIDHVAETMVQPVAMSDVFFGEMYEPEGYLDKTTELGALVTRIGFNPDPTIPGYDHFVITPPALTVTR